MRNVITLAIVAVCGIVAQAHAQDATGAAAGEILIRNGSVLLWRGQQRLRVSPGRMWLQEGDLVEAEIGADAVILDQSSMVIRVLEYGKPVKVSKSPGANGFDNGIMKLVSALFQWDPAHDRSVASARGEHDLAAAFPDHLGVVLTTKPVLIWNRNIDTAQILLYHNDGTTRFSKKVIDGSYLNWPIEQIELEYGKLYEWEIYDDNDPSQTDLSRFSVASRNTTRAALAEANRIRNQVLVNSKSHISASLAVAAYYLGRDYKHAAAAEILLALEKYPNNPELKFLFNNIILR